MIKPIGDYIIVKQDELIEQTQSGIYLPEKKSDKPHSGIVVEISDTLNIPQIKKGVKIYFKMWAGEPLDTSDKNTVLIHKKDIVAYEEN